MKIKRDLFEAVLADFQEGNSIVLIYGARQTGKTTLSNEILEQIPGKKLYVNADEILYHDVLSSRDLRKLRLLIEDYDIVFIDEAQRIKDIGINLKIIHDQMPEKRLLVTGSSALDLAGKIKEPLTGRTSGYRLFPISLSELRKEMNVFELQNRLEEFMIYGMYPRIFHFNSASQKEKYLLELTSSYLYRDVLELKYIKNSSKITQLLRLLALQTGSEVSVYELARNLGLSHETVNAYLDLLEQSFIIFRLSAFGRNLRKEISKRNKIFFWDTGIRNTLLNNYAPLDLRVDKGALWENFIIAERLKFLNNKQNFANAYFWRTYTGVEVDYVEERHGKVYAYEIKWTKTKSKAPVAWVENYGSDFECISKDNFIEFLT